MRLCAATFAPDRRQANATHLSPSIESFFRKDLSALGRSDGSGRRSAMSPCFDASKGGYVVHFRDPHGTALVATGDWIVP